VLPGLRYMLLTGYVPALAQALKRGMAGGLLAYLAVEQCYWEVLHAT